MTTITLTSDFGLKDHYLAKLKGLLISQLKELRIIDISNEIDLFNIQMAAFQVKQSWESFPQSTIHFIWVGDQYRSKTRWIACKHNGHFFVLPNNGLITLILSQSPEQVVVIDKSESDSQMKFLVKCIAQIADEKSILGIGEPTTGYLERLVQKPIVSKNLIRGQIQYIDHFGNLVTNIEKSLFDDQKEAEDHFEIITRAIQIFRLKSSYSEEEPGEVLALFNSSGFLQISINQGNASELLGLRVGDPVQIEFR